MILGSREVFGRFGRIFNEETGGKYRTKPRDGWVWNLAKKAGTLDDLTGRTLDDAFRATIRNLRAKGLTVSFQSVINNLTVPGEEPQSDDERRMQQLRDATRKATEHLRDTEEK
jgi:hypothetical protein